MRRALALCVVAAPCVVAALPGCADAEPEPPGEEVAARPDSITPAGPYGVAPARPDSLAPARPDSVAAPAPEPDPLPSLPGEGPPRLYRLHLVNRLETDALVFASASAERVVLDTVPGRDSVHVDIRLRADEVVLEAEDESGRRLSSVSLDLTIGGVHRWVIVDRGDPPGRSRIALVRRESARYPRVRPDVPRR